MESSIRTSKQKAVKKVIAYAYDNMAVEEFGMPEKSQVVQTEGKDMEKLCPETTFTRNVRPLCGKNVLIIVLALTTLVSVSVNILLLTRGNLQHESTSTFQTNNGETDGVMKSSIRTDCSDTPCLNGATCHESFTCDCMPGYEGDLCETDIDDCLSQPCMNGATCYHDADSFLCVCAPGYEGPRCETDVDECASEPCLNGGTCYDGVDDFICDCMPGYTGTFCQTNIDVCLSKPCLNGGTCYDGGNSFTCVCTPEYEGTFCEIGEAQSYLVMLGGAAFSGESYSACDVYELSGNRSDAFTLPPLPEIRTWAAVVDTEKSIYIIGGCCYNDEMYKLTKATKMWSELAPMHMGRYDHRAVEVNNTIIVVEGKSASGRSSVEIYNITSNSWRTLNQDSDYPMTIYGHAACFWRNRVYVSGGWSNTVIQAGVYRFSLETERWTWFADLVHARQDHSMVVVDDRLYVLDGRPISANQIEMYDESLGKFTVIANSPLSIHYTNAVVLDSKIIIAGGYNNDKMVIFDTVTRNFVTTDVDLRREYYQSHVALITT